MGTDVCKHLTRYPARELVVRTHAVSRNVIQFIAAEGGGWGIGAREGTNVTTP